MRIAKPSAKTNRSSERRSGESYSTELCSDKFARIVCRDQRAGHCGIPTLLIDELAVSSLLDNLAGIEHEDLIACRERVHAVANDDDCSMVFQRFEVLG